MIFNARSEYKALFRRLNAEPQEQPIDDALLAQQILQRVQVVEFGPALT